MSLGKVLVCCLLPPLAVWSQGCGPVLIVALLTCAGWVPGALAALFLCSQEQKKGMVPQITIINQTGPDNSARPR